MSTVIAARNLTRRFGSLTAVDNLNLEVKAGEIFGLLGPDGAGKSTTLRMFCGLLDPSSGEAGVAGHDPARDPQALKDDIGYMAQRFGLYGDLTVEENMLFYADLFGMTGAARDSLMDRLLRMTRMSPFRARPAGRLSGGMKQKLALMCTLLHHPRILFLDEPTNGVDPLSRRDFWTILQQLVQQGLTVFLTTAYLDEAERCDRVGLMDRGRMICCGSPAALKQDVRETCFELRCADLRAARSLLAAQPGVSSAEPAGASVHIFADETTAPAAVLEGALHRAGLGPVDLRPIAPTLEDVFILRVREAARAAA